MVRGTLTTFQFSLVVDLAHFLNLQLEKENSGKMSEEPFHYAEPFHGAKTIVQTLISCHPSPVLHRLLFGLPPKILARPNFVHQVLLYRVIIYAWKILKKIGATYLIRAGSMLHRQVFV